jgi:hypothetical protein
LSGSLAGKLVSLFVWLVMICSERKVLLVDCWWLVRKVLLTGG